MKHPIHIISLGGSNSKLLTIECIDTLTSSDIIFCPSITDRYGICRSRSAEILEEAGIDTIAEKISLFDLPMKMDRSHAKYTYTQLALNIKDLSSRGEKISVVCEGDSGIYSSVHYLSEECQKLSLDVVKSAGIPSFIAAGALAGISLIKGDERLVILTALSPKEELLRLIEEGYNIVIMKPSLNKQLILDIIKIPLITAHYFENIGLPQQYYSSNPSDIEMREIPYFSLLIIQNQERI